MDEKMLLVSFHCDVCGKDTHVAGTEVDKERDGEYHCLHCGNKSTKSFYTFDDFYVKRVR